MICNGERVTCGADLRALARAGWLIDGAAAGWRRPMPASFVIGMPWRLIDTHMKNGRLFAAGPQSKVPE